MCKQKSTIHKRHTRLKKVYLPETKLYSTPTWATEDVHVYQNIEVQRFYFWTFSLRHRGHTCPICFVDHSNPPLGTVLRAQREKMFASPPVNFRSTGEGKEGKATTRKGAGLSRCQLKRIDRASQSTGRRKQRAGTSSSYKYRAAVASAGQPIVDI